MKKSLTSLLALLFAVALLATACGSDDVTETSTGAGDSTEESGSATPNPADSGDDGAVSENIQRLWVGPQLVDCIGEAPQKCLQIRRTEDGQVEWFYDSIEGFTHEVGTTYVIDVEVTEVDNPPADASSLSYRLVEIVEQDATATSDQIDGTSWNLIGFRDGDLFDRVPEGVAVTLNFADGQANGSAGCNNYMGGYTADGAALTFAALAATKKACPGDAMDVENRFLPLIGATETAELTFDNTLVLSNPTGPNLVFEPAG